MLNKLLLLLAMPIYVFANSSEPIMHENELRLYIGDKKQNLYADAYFFIANNSLVPDKYNQSTQPFSIRPMSAWGGVEDKNWHNGFLGDQIRPGYLQILVTAPRKNNANVAQWAASQQSAVMNDYNKGKVYARVAGSSLAKAPDELNFAFMGTLEIDYYSLQFKCYNIIIGQGHSGADNNWWIYSNFWPMDKNGEPAKSGYRDRIQCVNTANGSLQQFDIKHRTSPYKFDIYAIGIK